MGWYHASRRELHYVCEPVLDFRSTPMCLIWSPRWRGSSSVGKVFLMAVNKMQDSKPLYVMPANILVAQVSHTTRPNIVEAEEDTLWGGILERMNVSEPSSHLPQGPRNRHISFLLSFSLSQGPEQNTQQRGRISAGQVHTLVHHKLWRLLWWGKEGWSKDKRSFTKSKKLSPQKPERDVLNNWVLLKNYRVGLRCLLREPPTQQKKAVELRKGDVMPSRVQSSSCPDASVSWYTCLLWCPRGRCLPRSLLWWLAVRSTFPMSSAWGNALN